MTLYGSFKSAEERGRDYELSLMPSCTRCGAKGALEPTPDGPLCSPCMDDWMQEHRVSSHIPKDLDHDALLDREEFFLAEDDDLFSLREER